MGIGTKIAQVLLIAFNFIFVLIGLAGIIVGAIIRVKYNDYEELSTKDVGGVSVLLIALGGIIFIVAFFGCCGAIRKSVTMLTIFVVLLVILLVIEIAAAITAYVYKDKLKDYVNDGMKNAFDHYYNNSKYPEAIDTVQKELKCCGINSSADYEHILHKKVPDSCCETMKNGTCSEVYSEGCVDALFDYLKDHLAIVGGIAVGVAVIQVIGIIFACVVRRDEKAGYGYV